VIFFFVVLREIPKSLNPFSWEKSGATLPFFYANFPPLFLVYLLLLLPMRKKMVVVGTALVPPRPLFLIPARFFLWPFQTFLPPAGCDWSACGWLPVLFGKNSFFATGSSPNDWLPQIDTFLFLPPP